VVKRKGKRTKEMGNLDDLAFLDATAQAELVRKKEVQPIELVEAVIERIEKLNPQINAVVTKMYDQARESAKGKLPDGPFTGVPFLLKDILGLCKGVPTTLGSRLLSNFIPDHDSELVTRLKRSGLVILGKTNVPEFGILPTTESQLFGPCRNPWDTGRIAGGSSGGAAAAVASGMVSIAHGNDGGGSIRIPASCCGVFGLKPTRARNPLGPDFGEGWGGLVTEHALTRSVRDSAALLDVTAGPDIGDPYWAPPPERPFLEEVGKDPGRLRIAHVNMSELPIHEDCLQAVRAAISLCRDLGHGVEEIDFKLDVAAEFFSRSIVVLIASGTAATLKLLGAEEGQVEPATWALAEMGKEFGGADYVLAEQLLQRSARVIAQYFIDFDMLIAPMVSEPPPPLGTFDPAPDNPLRGFDRAGQFVHLNPLANVTGNPAMSVPLFWNADDLPIGVLFMGRFGDEAALFRLASQLETARPWSHRRPPVS
jgi:amidase